MDRSKVRKDLYQEIEDHDLLVQIDACINALDELMAEGKPLNAHEGSWRKTQIELIKVKLDTYIKLLNKIVPNKTQSEIINTVEPTGTDRLIAAETGQTPEEVAYARMAGELSH